MNDQIEKSFKVLELVPGASVEEIKKAYRVLVKVWHPDRFPSDRDLQQRALEKMKEINNAYELLTSNSFSVPQTPPSPAAPVESTPFIKVDRFIFYGRSFDETTQGESHSKAKSASRLVTQASFKVISDWMQNERNLKLEIVQTLPAKSGFRLFSHADYQQRHILFNNAETLTTSSVLKAVIRAYIRDKLSGVASDEKYYNDLSRGLKDLGWNGNNCLLGESYFRAESILTNVGSDDLIDRLLDEGSAGYWADTRMLYKLSYGKGPHSVEDWGRFIGMSCKNNPAYR